MSTKKQKSLQKSRGLIKKPPKSADFFSQELAIGNVIKINSYEYDYISAILNDTKVAHKNKTQFQERGQFSVLRQHLTT